MTFDSTSVSGFLNRDDRDRQDCVCMEESRNLYRVLVVKPEGKGTLGKPRGRWEGKIKMNLEEVGSDPGNGMNLAFIITCNSGFM